MENTPKMHEFSIHLNEETGNVTSFRSNLSNCDHLKHPYLVFLHGFNGSSKSWAFQQEHFNDRGVIAIDAPGFGESSKINKGMDAIVVEVAHLIRFLKIGRPVLVGHSMGGMTAQVLAAKYPNLFSALVLSCTHKGRGEPIGSPLSDDIQQRIQQRKILNNMAYGDLRVRKMLDGYISPSVFSFLSDIAGEITVDALECGGIAMQTLDTTPMLPSIEVPVTVIVAEKDIVISKDATMALIEGLPACRTTELKGVGHAPYCEDPQAFNKVIEDLIATI
jgi:pimeloyl-ACP methyl ester carboxylesterase